MASLTCAVHCALMPFVLALLPAAMGAGLASGWVEWSLFAASAMVGLASMRRGGRIHGRGVTKAAFAAGLAMLALGRVSEEREWGRWSVAVLVLGGATVALAHLVNGRLCRACATCHRPATEATGESHGSSDAGAYREHGV